MNISELTVKTLNSCGADVPLNDIDWQVVYKNYETYLEYLRLRGMNYEKKSFEDWYGIMADNKILPIYPDIPNYIKINGLDFSNYEVVIRSGSAIKGLTAYNASGQSYAGMVKIHTTSTSVYKHPIDKALFQITSKFYDEEKINLKELSKEYVAYFYNKVFGKNYDPTSYETVYEIINEHNSANVIYDGNRYKRCIFLPARSTTVIPSGLIYNNEPTHPEERKIPGSNDKGCSVRYVGPLLHTHIESFTLIDADYPNAYSIILHNLSGYDMYINYEDIYVVHGYKKNIGLFNEVKVLDNERTAGFGSTDE